MKVMFKSIHCRKQHLGKTQTSKTLTKYPIPVVMNGTIGEICGCQVVKSKKVKLVKYEKQRIWVLLQLLLTHHRNRN